MVNNQIEFNEKYSKKIKEIEIECEDFEEQLLVIENYPNLEKLYLQDVDNIEKITLKNLTQLQECTIWNCSTKDLVIENCPQIRKINVRSNLLTSLEFLGNLEELEELEIDDLKKSREDLKEEVSSVTSSTTNSPANTKELVFNLGKEFKDKEEKINSLELRVRELTELSKNQRQKIQIHLESFGSEQELLKRLIIEYATYTKLDKEKLDTDDHFKELRKCRDSYQKARNELENKLEETDMIRVERILKDFERLQPIIQQIFNNSSFNISGSQLAFGEYANASLVSQTQSITIHYNHERLQKELDNVAKRYQELELVSENQNRSSSKLTQSEKQRLKKTVLFLGTKCKFATTRQETISNLKDKYNELEESNKKYKRFVTAGDVIKEIGEVVNDFNTTGGTLIKLLAKGVSVATNILKNNSSAEQTKEFGDYLFKDEAAMSLLGKTCRSLAETIGDSEKKNPINSIFNLHGNQFSSFEKKYNVFQVSGIKKEDASLSTEQMKQALDSLNDNLETLMEEFQKEARQYEEKIETFFDEEDSNFLQAEFTELLEKLTGKESSSQVVPVDSQEPTLIDQQEALQIKIRDKKDYLEELKTSANNKLKSRISVIPVANDGKREDIFLEEKFLIDYREELLKDTKLTSEEIHNLCQVQIELTQLQLEQAKLQEQQTTAQIQF
ncbi:6949_t:CDS:2 [Cetraspora pellucida]|uniref:6949_t:CDS:1 n=1 Tax=Cetraspora pellucida TaxID=1433469 RepID=A0ACA9LSI4_9GLOM|nr:6949_t:CDS:2 [Cetraspora pellucida]